MAIYSDINNIDPTVNFQVSDVESVYASISNILSIRKTEKLFVPEFGSSLEDLLFEPIDDLTALGIYNNIVTAIDTWDKRVKLDYGSSEVIPYESERKYEVILFYQIIGFGEESFEFRGELVK